MFAVVFVCIQSWHKNTKLMFVNIAQHLHSTYTSDSNEVILKNVEESTPILTKTLNAFKGFDIIVEFIICLLFILYNLFLLYDKQKWGYNQETSIY